MHEMSYVVRFVNQAIESFQESGEKQARVSKVCVSVGEMTDVLPEYLYKYFPIAVKGTVIEGAELSVEMVEAGVACEGCGEIYRPTRENGYRCTHCGDTRGRVVAGRDVVLEQIEVV